ncbi:MAG: hypothetical protein E6867_03340 [Staphylococcus epidermidis]|nr:hypothetical protein [Staphylococcus epidermidis]MDU5376557.1 hypothetical protein [Staphylococcus warneri]MDU6064707.1 hypothetical protein [Anaerococcus sp.]MDU7037821.1 hypothetical protein [Lactococcus lactis]MDU1612334.1 hypothetical protein [Staphylococcus epidermidis]
MRDLKKIHEIAIKIIELAEKEKWSEEELLKTIDLLHLQNENTLSLTVDGQKII